jgi:aspartate kinase
MPIVVQKYGGSSVADVTRIQKVAERIMRTKAAGYDVAVVVSAMGDTTDELLALARKVSPNPDRRELDMLLSAGERISMALLSMAIRELGADAISFTGSQSGIITNDRHVDARIVEVRPFRVQDELARGRVVVIAGYQGVSYRRDVTTLGRGGSDTTAVATAAALGAEWCEICSDVDGVYTADPRTVSTARRIDALTYEETQELAEAGAKVLNASGRRICKREGHCDLRSRDCIGAAGERPHVGRYRRAPPRATDAGHRRRCCQRARSPGPPGARQVDSRRLDAGRLRGQREAAPCCQVRRQRGRHDAGHLPRKPAQRGSAEASSHRSLRRRCAADRRARRGEHRGHRYQCDLPEREARWNCLQENGIQASGVATSSFRATRLIERRELDRAVQLLHALFVERVSA